MQRIPLLFNEDQRFWLNEQRKTGKVEFPILSLRYSILKFEQSITKEMIMPFLRLISRVVFRREL